LSEPALLTTPLAALHHELGARMVPFAGYSMPVQYPAGLMAEHLHTRAHAGLFDVSHMGQLMVRGAGAAAALETLMPVDVQGLAVGRQRYGLLLNDAGGIIDDLMFFRQEENAFFIIVNGACKVGDIAHIRERIAARCNIETMPDHGLLALHGPEAVAALEPLVPGVARLVFMSGAHFTWQGTPLFITRSGYTGEDGFEISVPGNKAEALARALLAQPQVQPIGLGARNSLRLEAGLCLYGNDIDATTTPPRRRSTGPSRRRGARAASARVVSPAPKKFSRRSPIRRCLNASAWASWRLNASRCASTPACTAKTARKSASSPAACLRPRWTSRLRWATCRPRWPRSARA